LSPDPFRAKVVNMANREVVVTSTAEPFLQSVTAGTHTFVADEPAAYGGADAGPNPYDLLLAALGTCTSMTVTAYARRKQWPLERVTVELRHSHVHAEDCVHCEEPARRIQRIERRLTLVGALTGEQRARLLEIAERCPVHKTLTGTLEIRTALVET
jgi:putative redox protein